MMDRNSRWCRIAPLGLATLVCLAVAGPALAKQTPPGDPPGNNGTIKIVADEPSDPDPGNEPHVDGCLVWLEYYGFDQDERVRITFEAMPPTGDAQTLLTHEAVISDDPAGGGQDDDDVLAFNLSEKLASAEPHPQQGYHVKVRSDSLDAPGGSKQKVFWLQCTPVTPGALEVAKTTEGGDGGPFGLAVRCNHAPLDQDLTLAAGESRDIPGVPAGTTCVVTEPDSGGASEVRFAEGSADGAADGKVLVTEGATATVTVTNVFGGAPQPETAAGVEVAGATELRPEAAPAAADVLPRTGTNPAVLGAIGLWALTLGGVAAVLGGRRDV